MYIFCGNIVFIVDVVKVIMISYIFIFIEEKKF